MEPRPLVSLGLAVHLVLARAELAKVLGSAWHDILEELERYPAEGLTYHKDEVSVTATLQQYQLSTGWCSPEPPLPVCYAFRWLVLPIIQQRDGTCARTTLCVVLKGSARPTT